MKNNNLLRTATLFSFIILLSGFVAFKGGAFDNYVSENAYPNEKRSGMPTDSPTPKKTVKKKSPEMMSSSKSMVLSHEDIKIDTAKAPAQKQNANQSQSKETAKKQPK